MTGQSALNDDAYQVAEQMLAQPDACGLVVHQLASGARVIDAGVNAPGGVDAGIGLARLCLAGRGEVVANPESTSPWQTAVVEVHIQDPVPACLASQYAGWRISVGDYFAMGSGPMRAAYGKEELYDDIGHRENATVAVGVLESDSLPGDEVAQYVSDKTSVPAASVVLAVAPTNSVAGGLQVVARSVETALHKLHALHFDLTRIEAGSGSAPLPPVASKSLVALGRTNDAMLYGARVTLGVRGDNASLEAIGPQVPASASKDYGTPFLEIFGRYDHDFYKIDPHLFSPAEITFHNLDTGNEFRFGQLAPEVLEKSFLD